MKILFTGSSSFTGHWFIRRLVEAGHEVTATFTADAGSYSGIRGERVALVRNLCRCEFEAAFGGTKFMELSRGQYDLLCHHGADVREYRSPAFDVPGAIAANTKEVRTVLERLVSGGCARILLTGSVFEEGEGAGSDHLRAFSPYAISKSATFQVFRFHAHELGLAIGKFVVPNPFGPWEEPRFTNYLLKTWLCGETAEVKSPRYVRDNIHVRLLATEYAEFAMESGSHRLSPSGYPERIDSFVARLAVEMRPRLDTACDYRCSPQGEFPEPEIRINTDSTVRTLDRLGETTLFDEMASWYLERWQRGLV